MAHAYTCFIIVIYQAAETVLSQSTTKNNTMGLQTTSNHTGAIVHDLGLKFIGFCAMSADLT
jgi:hypothetical protein